MLHIGIIHVNKSFLINHNAEHFHINKILHINNSHVNKLYLWNQKAHTVNINISVYTVTISNKVKHQIFYPKHLKVVSIGFFKIAIQYQTQIDSEIVK